MHLLIWPVLWATVFFKLLSAPSVCSSSPWVVELVVWSIQRLQLTSERVILCSSLFTVHCSVQCSARHQACPSDQRAAVFSRELGAGAGHSTISVTNYANPRHPPPTHHHHHHHHHHHNPHRHHSHIVRFIIRTWYSLVNMLGFFQLLNVNLKQLDSNTARRDYLYIQHNHAIASVLACG